jgi:LPXTG-site transpeptidase (sortase) family protein
MRNLQRKSFIKFVLKNILVAVVVFQSLLFSHITPAQAQTDNANITKVFNPSIIARNGITQLSVTISNPNAFDLTNVTWTDSFPAGLTIATTPQMTSDCLGDVTANAGDNKLTLANGFVAANGTCSVTVDVVAGQSGNLINTIDVGGLTANGGTVSNTVSTTDTLQVYDYAANLTKVFSPSVIGHSEVSRLSVTISNPNAFILTNAVWTDTFPTGLKIASTLNMISDCGGSVIAAAGSSTLSLTRGTIPANGSCTIAVDVSASQTGALINTIDAGVLTANGNGGLVNNIIPATTTLNVASYNYSAKLIKSFLPAYVAQGATSTLSVTISNPNSFSLSSAAWADTLPTGITIAPIPNPVLTNCGGSTTIAADALASSFSFSGGTVPAKDATGNGVCTLSVDVVADQIGNLTNTIDANVLTATGNGGSVSNPNPASAVLNVATFNFNAEINKSFSPDIISPGAISKLSITVYNPNTFLLTNTAWVDHLDSVQPGIKIASNPNIVNDVANGCGGTVTAVAGGDSVSLIGGTVPAQVYGLNGQCTISVDVTSTTQGNLTNTIPSGALTSDGPNGEKIGNTDPAIRTLRVNPISVPSITKSFAPNTVWVEQTSRMTINIRNNDTGNSITETSLTDVLPLNVVLADTVSESHLDCGPSVSVTAVPGTDIITINNVTIAPSTICAVAVNVKSAIFGEYINRIEAGAIHSKEGVTNSSPAQAGLNVQAVVITKAFFPTTFQAGDTSVLTITLENRDTLKDYTNVYIKDVLPGTLQAVSGTAGTTCVNALGDQTVTLSGTPLKTIELNKGKISKAINSNTPTICTITVTVTTTSGAVNADTTYTNTIAKNVLTTAEGITNLVDATAKVTVTPITIDVFKSFSPDRFQAGDQTTLTITLGNATTKSFTDIGLVDAMPDGLLITGTPSTNCVSGSVSFTNPPTTTQSVITLNGASLVAGASCTITVQVTTDPAATTQTYKNTMSANTVTSYEGVTNLTGTDGSVDIYTAGKGVTGSKSFNPNVVLAGVRSQLTIDLYAPADQDLHNFSVTDTLPLGLVIFSTPGVTSSGCGVSATAVPGDNKVSLSGGTILKTKSCRIQVYVTGNSPATYTNTLNPTDISNTEVQTLNQAITADLRITNLKIRKIFYPTTVSPNGFSTLTITLENTNVAQLINVSLTDSLTTMGDSINGVIVAPTPNASTTCGSGVVTAAAGSKTITMTGGTIPSKVGSVNGICTILVDVQGKRNVTTPPSVTFTNNIPVANVSGKVDILNGPTIQPELPAAAPLTITDLVLGVIKGFNPLTVFGGTLSTLSITLDNTNNVVLTGLAFTDTLPLGMYIGNPVDPSTGTCGGTLTALPGGTQFSYSGGTLNANKRCTLTLNATMNVNGNRTNTIPALGVTSFNGANNLQPASATLTNLPGASVTKFFTPNTIVLGDTSELTIRIKNTGNIPLTKIGLVDVLPAGLTIAASPVPSNTCNVAPVDFTAAAGTSRIEIANGSMLAGPNTTCDIKVTVNAASAGSYTNTIPARTLTTNEGATNPDPASDTLTVNSTPDLQLVKTGLLDMTQIAPSGSAEVGDVINYTLVATNMGDVTLKNVTISDPGVVLGTCTPAQPATLLKGETLTCSASYTLLAADITAKLYSNTATVTSKLPDGITDGATDTDTQTIPINVDYALGIKKIVTNTGPFRLNDTINYSITVSNLGLNSLTNISVTDPGVNVTLGTCSPIQGSTLLIGEKMICSATHLVTAADVNADHFTNIAIADSVETTPVSDTVTVPVKQNARLEVFKEIISNGPYIEGSTITYDISAKNTGDQTLNNVSIIDLPVVPSDPDYAITLGTCTPTQPAILQPGEILSCPATHVVTAKNMTDGGFSNTAQAASDETDPVTATATVILKTPSIQLSKVGTLADANSNGLADAGEIINYVFTITNNGQVTLTNIILTDIIGGITISGGPLLTIAPAAVDNTTFSGTYTLKQSDIDSGIFTNTAIVTGFPPVGSPVSAPAIDTQSGMAKPVLELVKSITSGASYNQPGAIIFYSYTLRNIGNTSLTGNGTGNLFTITDDRIGAGTPFTCGLATSLAPGGVESITCTNSYMVTQADIDSSNSITNHANGHGKLGTLDVVSNQATATATEASSWNATLAKTLETTEVNGTGNDNTQAVIGETLTYKLTSSFPPGSTMSAKIVDTLNAGLALVAVDSVSVSNPDADGEFGNADVGVNSSKMTFDSGSGLCTNCAAGTNVVSSNPFVENSGAKLTIDFGKIINTSTVDETVTIIYRVMVLNVSTNQSTTTPLRNTAVFSWTGSSVTRSANAVAIVEPNINITKTVDIVSGVDAGNLLTYTVTITNPALLTAYDATLTDAFPYNATSLASQLENITITNVIDTDLVAPVTAAHFAIVCDDTPTCAAPNRWTLNTVTPFDMPQNRTITLTITANVSPTTLPNAVIDNYAQVRWTSMDGVFSDRSTFVTDISDSERTGADGPGGLLNDYAKQSPIVARTTLTNLAGTKYYMASSEVGTSDVTVPPRVTIGEVVRYRIALRLNEGTMPDLSVLDRLSAGLQFINDGQVKVAFVSNGGGITSTTLNNLLPNCAGLNLTGTVADNTITGLLSSSITCPLPDTAISNNRTANTDVYASGTDVYFKFGDIINSDNDASDEFIVVEFNAVVENVLSNQGQNNLTGVVVTTTRNNDFQANINTASTPVLLFTTTPTVDVRIAEPAIADLAKTVSAASGDAGDQITYTVTFSNSNSVNASPAYDVVLTDNVPAKMIVAAIVPATDITFTPALCGALGSDTSVSNAITLTFTSLNAGCAVSVRYRATLQTSVIPGEVLTNNAIVNYSSLLGISGTTPNPTGSNTPGATGTATGERNGTGGQGVDGTILNNYRDLASTTVTITAVQPVKSLVSSSDLLTLGSTLTIGEVARYRLMMILAEGTSPILQLRDNIPAGLQYLNDGNTRLAFVSDNGISTCAGSTATISSSDITIGTSPWVCGNEITIAAITPTFALPNAAITGGAFVEGTDPIFNLGTVVNIDADLNTEYLVLEFNARVLNVAGNQDVPLTTINNSFTVLMNAVDKGTSSNAPLTLVEPILSLSKQLTSITGAADAGGVANYSVTFTNTGTAPAYESNFIDTLPAVLDFNLASVNVAFSGGASGQTDNSSDPLNLVNVTIGTIPVGGSVTITYTANIGISVTSNQLIQNTGNVTWTSLAGTDANERNGSGGINNYSATSNTVSFRSTSLVPVKSIVSTTAAHTSEAGDGSAGNARDLTIGEVIRYRLTVTIPEGTNSQLQLRDTLPVGFTYLNDGNTRIAFVANASMTAESDLTGANTSALPPTFVLPSNRISVLSQVVTFTIADLATPNDLVNNDSDSDSEYLVIDFNVRVNNDANNNNTDLDSNNFDLVVGGTTVGTSNSVGTRIIEPLLNITKSVDDNTWQYGQTLLYTLQLNHTVASLTAAQDVVVADKIPAGLTYVSGSISAPAGWVANAASAPNQTWTCSGVCSMLTTDGILQFTYQARVDDPPVPPALPGGGTATNTASVTWSSLSGTDANERTYTGSASVTGTLDQYLYALGNRVWFDTNNNGLIDANPLEVGVNNVRVDLYKDDGTGNLVFQRFTTTTNGGYYLFDYLAAGDYVVVIPASNFVDSAVLDGYHSSATSMNSSGAIIEAAAPASNTDIDLDDNGTFQTAGTFIGGVTSSPVTLGGTEPINESDLNGGSQGVQPDNRANMTLDFGFYRTAIGNQVWFDENADGKYDAGETLINGVPVKLYVRNGAVDTEILVGPDGMLGTSDDLTGNVTTDINGRYSFTGLPEGNYIIKVIGPVGSLSTIDTFNLADTTTPTNVDNNDNGIGKTSNSVSSGTITMDAGSIQNSVNQNNGTSTNSTLDFGFVNSYALGNRVWFDINNNGHLDLLEIGAAGVTVQLYSTADLLTVVDTAITNANGYYLFDNVFPGEYVIVIPTTNFVTGVLAGYWSSDTKRGADGVIGETIAPDADTDIDSDDNGTLQTTGGFIGAITSSPVTVGPFGLTESTNELDLQSGVGQGTQPDGRANMTVDFGFYRVEIGNLIYSDGNQSGNYEALNDVALSGVTVQLYVTDGTTQTEVNVGPDGVLGTSDDVPGGMLSNVNGLYLFGGLPQGDYIIKVTPPLGTSSTIDTYNVDGDNLNPNVNADNNDNGIGTAPGIVSSGLVTLTPGSTGAPGYNNNTITYDTGATRNPTLDFGFIPAFALGNRVWYDTNNNGQITGTEVGIANVTLELYNADASGTITTSTGLTAATSAGGYYLFDNIPAGNYVVVIPASNFASGGALNGYWSSDITRATDGSISESTAALSNTDTDSDDNGTLQTSGALNGAVISSFVSLGPNINTEPSGESDIGPAGQGQPDRQANMTVDFGFYTIQLGNQVWGDTNNSGLHDSAETGISGVNLELWPADGSGAVPLAIATSDISGNYVFTGLPRGDYLIRIPHTQFEGTGTLRNYVSSTGGVLNPYEPAPDPDSDFTESDDNGTEAGGALGLGGYIQSSVVSLTPAGEGSVNDALGLTNEPRVDFGVFKSPSIDLSITKTDKTLHYTAGGTLNYEIVVTNAGPADVVDAAVTDTIPAQISTWTWSCAVGTPLAYNCTGAASNSLNFADSLDLPIGTSVTYNVTAKVGANATGDLTNQAVVNLPAGSLITELNINNNTAQDMDTLASLTVTKNDGVTVVGPASSLPYTIIVQNNGVANLNSISVTDTLPADLVYQNANPVPTTISGNVLTWSGLSLTSGSNLTISVTASVVNSPSSSSITNKVDVVDTNTGATATASDVDSVVVNSNFTKTLADISESFTKNSDVAIGEIVTYEITANLAAGVAFDNVVITDRMDKGLAFVECASVTSAGVDVTNTFCPPTVSEIVDIGDAGNPANPGRQIQFNIGNIAANSSASTLVIRYRAVVLDVIENQETVALNNNAAWVWLGGSVSASAGDVNIVEPDLSIDKSALPTSATAGTAIEFTLAIAHTAQSSADAFDVAVTDILPAGLEFITCTPISYLGLLPTTQPDPCLVTADGLSFVWDTFPLNETATIKFFARYTGAQQTLTNNASVAWSSLPLDPAGTPPSPVQLSAFNLRSTERWYDPLDLVNVYQVVGSVKINPVPDEGKSKTKWPKVLPATGFAPDRITTLSQQPADKFYSATDVQIEIPNIGINIPIVGVPLVNSDWDVSWLWRQAGWLNGTAFPGWQGNSVLTGHITLSNGKPGPFEEIDKLKWGDEIVVHAYGSVYTYVVRENRTIAPNDTSVLQHEEQAWLTLLTCKTYNERTDTYSGRIAVRAVLLKVEVEHEKQSSDPSSRR